MFNPGGPGGSDPQVSLPVERAPALAAAHAFWMMLSASPLPLSSSGKLQDETAGIKSRDCSGSGLTWAPQAWLKAALEPAEINVINANFLISCCRVIREWESIKPVENGWEQAGCSSALLGLRCFALLQLSLFVPLTDFRDFQWV